MLTLACTAFGARSDLRFLTLIHGGPECVCSKNDFTSCCEDRILSRAFVASLQASALLAGTDGHSRASFKNEQNCCSSPTSCRQARSSLLSVHL